MNHVDLKQISVLYVEDESAIRDEVAHYLERRLGGLFLATNGEEGLDAFSRYKPDVVVSDITMPIMDGLVMAEMIKRQNPSTPIIFATAFNDAHYLHSAISIGIDGYVLKPIDLKQLIATITKSALQLLKARELTTSRAQLQAYFQAAEEERVLVAELMARMMHPEKLRDEQLRYFLKPTDVVGGDLIAVSRSRNNKIYFMLADSTGHGLPAALNLLPVNHIFYRMVSKCLPISLIVEEMNWAVREQSPADRYVAALVGCVDVHNRTVEVWNGGIPPAIFINAEGDVCHTFKSANLPLGILDRTFTAESEIYQWRDPGQVFVYSDGFADAESENAESFGDDRLMAVLKATPPEARHDALIDAVQTHLGTRKAFDDMTLMVVECDPRKVSKIQKA